MRARGDRANFGGCLDTKREVGFARVLGVMNGDRGIDAGVRLNNRFSSPARGARRQKCGALLAA